jgi:hypothetical protein
MLAHMTACPARAVRRNRRAAKVRQLVAVAVLAVWCATGAAFYYAGSVAAVGQLAALAGEIAR